MLNRLHKSLFLLLIFVASQVVAGDLDSTWKIVLPTTPDPTEELAATELQHYLELVGGVKLPIEKTGAATAGKANIVIGTPQSVELFRLHEKELGLGNAEIDQLAVRGGTDYLWLAGSNPRSALYAVYTFLQDSCGVRWLWAGSDGEFLPCQKKLNVEGVKLDWRAPIKYRGFHFCGVWGGIDRETETWMSRHKLNILRSDQGMKPEGIQERRVRGMHIMFSNHNVTLPPELFKSEPERFALRNGKRIVDQICWSDLRTFDLVLESFTKVCREHPELEILSLFPSDNRNYCQCPACSKLPIPDLWFGFLSRLAARLKSQYPRLKVASIAYDDYHFPPPQCDLSGLDFVEYCHYDRCYVHPTDCPCNQTSLARIDTWKKKGVKIGIYGYEFDAFLPSTVMLPFYHMLGDQMRRFQQMNLMFVMPEMNPRNNNVFINGNEMTVLPQTPSSVQGGETFYNRQRLAYYIYAETLSKPDADVDTMIGDYCNHAYAAAGGEMSRYFIEMSNAWTNMNIHLVHYGIGNVGIAEKLLNHERIERITTLFQRAEVAAGAMADSVRRKQALGQIALEKKIFEDWCVVYRKDQAAQVKVAVPRRPASGDFTGAVRLPDFAAAAKQSTYPTTLEMNYDPTNLYVRVTCRDPHIDRLEAVQRPHDAEAIFREDESVTLFICSPADIGVARFRQFTVNPQGSRYDATDVTGTRDVSWNPKWDARVTRDAAGYTYEIAIPFAELGGSPRDSGSWSFSACRSSGKRTDFSTGGFPNAEDLWNWNAFAPLRFVERERSVTVGISCRPVSFPMRVVAEMSDEVFKGGYTVMCMADEAAFTKVVDSAQVIIVSHTPSSFPLSFYREQLRKRLEQGAIVILTSSGPLPLSHYFESPKLDLRWSGWDVDPKLEPQQPRTAKWLTFPNDIASFLKSRQMPSNGHQPVYPEQWENWVSVKKQNGELYSALLTKKIGKGTLVVTSCSIIGWGGPNSLLSGNADQLLMLIDNLLNSSLPASNQPDKPPA